MIRAALGESATDDLILKMLAEVQWDENGTVDFMAFSEILMNSAELAN